jgi:hypothetical protein
MAALLLNFSLLFCFWYSLSRFSGLPGIDIVVPRTSFIPLYPLSQIASLIGVVLVWFAEVIATSRVFESCSFLLCATTPTITPESFVATIVETHELGHANA